MLCDVIIIMGDCSWLRHQPIIVLIFIIYSPYFFKVLELQEYMYITAISSRFNATFPFCWSIELVHACLCAKLLE